MPNPASPSNAMVGSLSNFVVRGSVLRKIRGERERELSVLRDLLRCFLVILKVAKENGNYYYNGESNGKENGK